MGGHYTVHRALNSSIKWLGVNCLAFLFCPCSGHQTIWYVWFLTSSVIKFSLNEEYYRIYRFLVLDPNFRKVSFVSLCHDQKWGNPPPWAYGPRQEMMPCVYVFYSLWTKNCTVLSTQVMCFGWTLVWVFIYSSHVKLQLGMAVHLQQPCQTAACEPQLWSIWIL
jgi:hypothetical protein